MTTYIVVNKNFKIKYFESSQYTLNYHNNKFNQRFQDQVIIVTGASSGIGEATARLLASQKENRNTSAREDTRPTKKIPANYRIPSKPPSTRGEKQSPTCSKLFRRRKTRVGCWPFPNCATTWRSVCGRMFSIWLPCWAVTARSGFQFETGMPSACSFAWIFASPGFSCNAA